MTSRNNANSILIIAGFVYFVCTPNWCYAGDAENLLGLVKGMQTHHSLNATQDEIEVAQLLKKGANPNVVDSKGWTPLHYAADKKLELVAVMLLEAGADPYVSSNHFAYGKQGVDGYVDAMREGNATEWILKKRKSGVRARDLGGELFWKNVFNGLKESPRTKKLTENPQKYLQQRTYSSSRKKELSTNKKLFVGFMTLLAGAFLYEEVYTPLKNKREQEERAAARKRKTNQLRQNPIVGECVLVNGNTGKILNVSEDKKRLLVRYEVYTIDVVGYEKKEQWVDHYDKDFDRVGTSGTEMEVPQFSSRMKYKENTFLSDEIEACW